MGERCGRSIPVQMMQMMQMAQCTKFKIGQVARASSHGCSEHSLGWWDPLGNDGIQWDVKGAILSSVLRIVVMSMSLEIVQDIHKGDEQKSCPHALALFSANERVAGHADLEPIVLTPASGAGWWADVAGF